MSVKFLAYQRIIIFNLTVTPLACILNLCSWIIGRSSVVNLDAIAQYISLNTVNLNNIRSYLKSWLRKQTLASKGEYSRLLEAFLKIPNLNVAVILGKRIVRFHPLILSSLQNRSTSLYFAAFVPYSSDASPRHISQTTLCLKIEIVFLARSLQPKNLLVNSFPQRIILTLPIIQQCITIAVCLWVLQSSQEKSTIEAMHFFLMGVMEGAQGKQGAWVMWKLRIRETQVNVSYQGKRSLILFLKETFKW